MLDELPFDVLLVIFAFLDFDAGQCLYDVLPKPTRDQLDYYRTFFERMFHRRVLRIESKLPSDARFVIRGSGRPKTIAALADLWHTMTHLEPYEMALAAGDGKLTDQEDAYLSDGLYQARTSMYSLYSVPYKSVAAISIGYVPRANRHARSDLRGIFIVGLSNNCVQFLKWCKLRNNMAVIYSFDMGETVDKIAVSRSVTGVVCMHLEASKGVVAVDLGQDRLVLRSVDIRVDACQILDNMFLGEAGDFAFVYNAVGGSQVVKVTFGADNMVSSSVFGIEENFTPFESAKNQVRFHFNDDRTRCLMTASNYCVRSSPCHGSLHQLTIVEVDPSTGFTEKSPSWRLHLPRCFRLIDWQVGPDEKTLYLVALTSCCQYSVYAYFDRLRTGCFSGYVCHQEHFVTRPGSIAIYTCDLWSAKVGGAAVEFNLLAVAGDEKMPAWNQNYNLHMGVLPRREKFMQVTENSIHLSFSSGGILSFSLEADALSHPSYIRIGMYFSFFKGFVSRKRWRSVRSVLLLACELFRENASSVFGG